MGHAIPKLQYKVVATTGATVLGDGTLSSIADTTDIVVGMFARGTGVPTGALVGSKTANTVTLAAGVLSTATGSGVALTFGYEVEFDYPPVEDTGENLETKATVSESLSGIKQTSVNYIEGTRKLKFSFLSPALKLLVDSFLSDSAMLGEDFRYYDDKTVDSYVTYSLETLKVAPRKIASRGANAYVWEVPLNFRRVL
jgi:hypothetical protein